MIHDTTPEAPTTGTRLLKFIIACTPILKNPIINKKKENLIFPNLSSTLFPNIQKPVSYTHLTLPTILLV